MRLVPLYQGVSLFGIILAPTGTQIVPGKCGPLLAVPTPEGTVRLSAADVLEQATVKGCNLSWATGCPRAARAMRGGEP